MFKPVAVAIRPETSHPVLASMKNSAGLLVDFMYGTPERTRLTMLFALSLAVLGMALRSAAQASAFCAVPIA